jgi:predicted nucleic acid-binding protein
MIYLDTSVALAHLLAEDRSPPAALWSESLVSSRLLAYELWIRIHARDLAVSHGEAVRDLVGRVALIELAPPVLERALEPFPTPVRTLDALHLASADFLRRQGQSVRLATYDDRMSHAAAAMGIKLYDMAVTP